MKLSHYFLLVELFCLCELAEKSKQDTLKLVTRFNRNNQRLNLIQAEVNGEKNLLKPYCSKFIKTVFLEARGLLSKSVHSLRGNQN